MTNPRCIRIFRTREEAKAAKKILATVHIDSYITEDGFRELKLKDLGMQSRFRLYIDKDDIDRAAKFLAKKIRETRLDR